MHKFRLSTLLAIAMTCLVISQNATAFSSSRYASTSKLASGKWVKIKVGKSGVYQLTDQELADMGFSNPNNVRIYGFGGNLIKELLNGSATDDLPLVPVKRVNGKICFYAKGPVKFTLSDPRTAKPHYTRTVNPYSNEGYYFLTEGSENDVITKVTKSNMGTDGHDTSLDYFYHEKELITPSFSGKSLLGERITDNENTFDVKLPGIVEGAPIFINPCVAAKMDSESGGYSSMGYINAIYHSGSTADTIPFGLTESGIRYTDNTLVFYNSASPVGAVTPLTCSENGKVEIKLSIPNDLSFKWGRLDYLMVTYQRQNSLANAENGQIQMGYNQITNSYRIEMPQATDDMVVWNIDNESSPVEYTCSNFTDIEGNQVKSFSPGLDANWAQFVAFSPSQDLLKISGYEEIENQNIHGLEAPDMVIVTSKNLMAQAERIADMHRNNDGFTVHVIDQAQAFNEFSSGTPDAMGIRLMNKMFYDRDNTRFKYFLILGCGSYDNRGITTSKKNRVITYESDNSNDENYSFVSDDFYGVLGDNSGNNIASDLLKIGIGRIPSATESEARQDVDKLLAYVNDPDYGVWRNNALMSCDEGDGNKHIFQAAGINDIINKELNTGIITDKAYVSLFPNATTTSEPGIAADHLTAVEARQHMANALKAGQFFWTYIGHAGSTTYTKYRHMWTVNEVQSVNYEHAPIFSAACCDVARYDSDNRGIAEKQFHKPNGGAIAVFTSCRSVYSDNNDKLNRAFTTNLFNAGAKGAMPRLGDIYLKTKQVFSSSNVPDKVKFHLMGDPAMPVNIPRPLFKITEVNGTAIANGSSVSTSPMQKLTITAQVMKNDGTTLDTDFTGDAYITLYDVETEYKSYTQLFNSSSVKRTVSYPRAQLAQVEGRVENGVFKASLIVPRYVESQENNGLISVYAHQEGTHNMVNGQFDGITINSMDAATCIKDNQAPMIEAMFFNDENQFSEGAYIPSSSTLYITASDDIAISNKSVGLSSAMTLVLDGGKNTYPDVKSAATITNEGKNLAIALPMSGFEIGQHTLTFTVSDAAGNQTSRTISFIAGPASLVTLKAEETPAVNKATFNIDTELLESPEVAIKVTDATGKLVWTKKATTFPVVWDLNDNDGNKVKPGLYRYWGTYQTSQEYGGTEISRLIVIDDYKRK